MSIALETKVKELQAKVDELAFTLVGIQKRLNDAQTPDAIAQEIARMNDRIEALKRKPGRPPKNG